jgi:hypothetical protein
MLRERQISQLFVNEFRTTIVKISFVFIKAHNIIFNYLCPRETAAACGFMGARKDKKLFESEKGGEFRNQYFMQTSLKCTQQRKDVGAVKALQRKKKIT